MLMIKYYSDSNKTVIEYYTENGGAEVSLRGCNSLSIARVINELNVVDGERFCDVPVVVSKQLERFFGFESMVM